MTTTMLPLVLVGLAVLLLGVAEVFLLRQGGVPKTEIGSTGTARQGTHLRQQMTERRLFGIATSTIVSPGDPPRVNISPPGLSDPRHSYCASGNEEICQTSPHSCSP